jgi:hypothetical protein
MDATLGLFICWWGMQALGSARPPGDLQHCVRKPHSDAASSTSKVLQSHIHYRRCFHHYYRVEFCALVSLGPEAAGDKVVRVSSHCLVALSQPI